MIPKFRAWMKSLKWMCEVTVIDYDLRSLDICRIGDVERYTEMSVDKDEVVLMQSTGLFDKNGVEIFEGDVVKQVLTQPTTEDDLTGVVIMIECAWLIVNDSKQKANLVWSETNENEVLGNIYENPELMEGNA
ncbi:YopX family protein [Streptococcus intermedius]|uniref:YopX family protein n=1 Tax=Streptococcus intermedius TaxID=1338 RepID=UPI0039C03FE9